MLDQNRPIFGRDSIPALGLHIQLLADAKVLALADAAGLPRLRPSDPYVSSQNPGRSNSSFKLLARLPIEGAFDGRVCQLEPSFEGRSHTLGDCFESRCFRPW